MSLPCVDGVVPDALPSAPLALGYVDGQYVTDAALRATKRFRLVVSVTVEGHPDAQVADCESGDLTPIASALWAIDRLRAGRRPTIYATASNRDVVVYELRRRRYRADLVDWFLADWKSVGQPRTRVRRELFVPDSWAAWQYASDVTWARGRFDLSVVTNRWALRHGYRLGTAP